MNFIIDDIKEILKRHKVAAYIVGGYVRDKLMKAGNNPKDIDIVYDGDIETFVEELRQRGYGVFQLKQEMGIYRAVIEDKILDIAKLKGNSIEEDLSYRDFTINAIALKLIENKIIDPYKGRNHLQSRTIHEVSEDSIKNDRIRILRAERLAIKYGFHFSKACEEHIIEESKYIKNCPKERIFNEFIRILEEDKDSKAFEELEKYGVLKHLMPYIEELKTIGKCRYHIEDAFTHMNLVYKNFTEILEGRLHIDGLDLNIFDEKLGELPIKIYMAFAAFSHDIGKVKCYVKNGDKVSFIGHDKVGARIIGEVCRKLGFPKRAQKFVEKLTEAHMYPLGLCKNKIKKYKKSFYKLFCRYDEYIPYILTLSYCDIHATKMLYDPDNEEAEFIAYLERLFKEYGLFRKVKDNKFLNGKEIIELTGAQGEEIKYILEELDRFTYYEEINSKEDAVKMIKGIRSCL
ncbi:HD domain-containing protein [Clostridium sp. ZS2-4]|uniref:HD domain-containing protein n=1 Tax=Clostridium sp. ZS2-4 TaxID=2987703 RepID=UPI00227B3F01|nr:HD domain-containing protein [Clostridium sp. ZS2-4]MCY6354772.1 CCA tRNA nucleotidyltransferase [Clostridium sp. ZS2-4]